MESPVRRFVDEQIIFRLAGERGVDSIYLIKDKGDW